MHFCHTHFFLIEDGCLDPVMATLSPYRAVMDSLVHHGCQSDTFDEVLVEPSDVSFSQVNYSTGEKGLLIHIRNPLCTSRDAPHVGPGFVSLIVK